jgi:hypothetical protein
MRAFKQIGHELAIKYWESDLIVNSCNKYAVSSRCPECAYILDSMQYDFSDSAYEYIKMGYSRPVYFVDSRDVTSENHKWLPYAYDEQLHGFGYAYDERPFAVVLYGQINDKRQKVLDEVKKITHVATGYGDHILYSTCYKAAKISLCQSRCGNLDSRFFESMAMGAVVVADRRADIDALGFIDGVDYLGYDTPDEAADCVERLLSFPSLAKSLQAHALQSVKPHSWTARVQKILEDFGLCED